MTVNRTSQLVHDLKLWAGEFERQLTRKAVRSLRVQWPIEGRDGVLTLFGNENGVFVQEPGRKPVRVNEWLKEPVA